VVAVAASIQPLHRAVHVDRLFASEDTRTLARDWSLQNLPSGSTVALQSYSVPLPQSKESFREALEANAALSELDRKGKYAHLLRVAEEEEKSFWLVFLGKGDERNRISWATTRSFPASSHCARAGPERDPPRAADSTAARSAGFFLAGEKGRKSPRRRISFPR
jgi:hypothetical protein